MTANMKRVAAIVATAAVSLAYSACSVAPDEKARDAGRSGPMRVVLSFDDGLKDHLLIAAPMLEERGWRGMFCIVTDWIGKNDKFMTWDDVRELVRRGHEVATHTKTHRHLPNLLSREGPDAVRAELAASRDVIADRTGFAPRYMCPPFVAHTKATARLCREERLEQMELPRKNFGSANVSGVVAFVEEKIKAGIRSYDLLHHGVSAEDHGGWSPFPTRKSFEAHLDAIKRLEEAGRIVVTDYDGACSPCSVRAKKWPQRGFARHPCYLSDRLRWQIWTMRYE